MNSSSEQLGLERDSVIQRYQPVAGVHDEMLSADGALRPSWSAIARWFESADPEALRGRSMKTERLLFENFSDPQERRQPWRLDIMPLALGEGEWRRIEAAAQQRARLMEALLNDIYGPQTLFASGVLPPGVVLSDPGFLRPLYGLQTDGRHLTFLALDIARGPAGDWRVLDVHAETPAGHGFVLANRMVVAEVSSDLFAQSRAQRLGPFYQALIDEFARRAGKDDPTIAVLTTGPGDDSYPGHAYLARYMGYLRVEGSDLQINDQRAFLKSVEGLRRIDLLIKAVAGRRADPLELAPDGFDGPVGLLSAVRATPGLVANALGAAVVENRGLSPFLPAIAQSLLGEELLFPDPHRLWLGDADTRRLLEPAIEDYLVHEAHEGLGSPGAAKKGVRPSGLDAQERARLLDTLRLHGAAYVAERPTGFATAPTWRDGVLSPAPFALRVFVAASGDDWMVMPGGVALTIDSDDNDAVALTSSEANSRDVWVIGDDEPSLALSLKRMASQNMTVRREARELQSRAADNLFWLGRYCERADATLRILRQTLTQRSENLAPDSHRRVSNSGLGHLAAKDAQGVAGEAPQGMAAIAALCESPDHAYGLPHVLSRIRGVALQCRDRLSIDSWRILSRLSADRLRPQGEPLRGSGDSADPTPANALDIAEGCDELLQAISAFSGMSHENMTRNRAWLFLDMGRRIERAARLSNFLGALFAAEHEPDDESFALDYALFVADSYLTYRSRYRFAPELPLVLDLLLIDENNPRSVVYQLSRLSSHVERLPRSADDAARAPEQRIALDILTRVRLADIAALSERDAEGRRPAFGQLLGDVSDELARLSQSIARHYFSMTETQPQRLQPNHPG